MLQSAFAAGAVAAAEPQVTRADAAGAGAATGECALHAGASAPAASERDALYQQFLCHFERGQYEKSLIPLQAACAQEDSPGCHFNLGAVHHALMQCEPARRHYARYLERLPYDADSQAVRTALRELSERCGPVGGAAAPAFAFRVSEATSGVAGKRSAPATSPIAAEVSPPPAAHSSPGGPLGSELRGSERAGLERDAGRPQRTAAWMLLGAASAAATASAIAAFYGSRADAEIEALHERNGGLGVLQDERLRAIHRNGRRYNTLAIALGATAGVVAGVGAVLWLSDDGSRVEVSMSSEGSPELSYARAF